MRFFWFSLIMISTMIITYLYIWYRLVRPANLKRHFKWLIATGLIFFPLITPISFLLRQFDIDADWIFLFSWIGFSGFGFISLLLAGLILRDMIFLFIKLIHVIQQLVRVYYRPDQTERPVERIDAQRRIFILNATNIGILGAAALLSGYGIYEARRRPILEKINIPLKNLPAEFHGFRIAQFSDIHAGGTIRQAFVQSAVDQVNQLHADAIVFTGDMVDGSVEQLREVVAPLRDLSAPHGIFFVTGNHEYYSGAEQWVEEMDRLGFTVLLNENRLIRRGEGKIVMGGVTDYSAGTILPEHQSDVSKALHDTESHVVKILLAHQPKSIFKAAEYGVSLQLSGHTHGGQYFPWKYVVTLDQPFIAGLNKYNNTWIYVNRGTGYWGPPVRVCVPSEITLFTLISADS